MTVNVDANKCTGCAICVDICPVDAITIEQVAVIDHETCIHCGSCVAECPNGALTMEEANVASPSPVAQPTPPPPPLHRPAEQPDFNPPRQGGFVERIVNFFNGSGGGGRGQGRGMGRGQRGGRGQGRGGGQGRGRGRRGW